MNMMTSLFSDFLRWCPGAIGILLRQRIYPLILGSCGKGVVFGRFIELKNPQNIHIANNSVLSSRCCLYAGTSIDESSVIRIESDVFIGIGTILSAEQASIHLESGANLGSNCSVNAMDNIEIGTNVLIAAYSTIGEIDITTRKKNGPIYIGDDVWLGARSHVSPQVYIDKGAIIGAHSQVDSPIKAYGIAVGRPATLQRMRT